jgi:hypothetical protein
VSSVFNKLRAIDALHGDNTGSNPVGDANTVGEISDHRAAALVFCNAQRSYMQYCIYRCG